MQKPSERTMVISKNRSSEFSVFKVSVPLAEKLPLALLFPHRFLSKNNPTPSRMERDEKQPQIPHCVRDDNSFCAVTAAGGHWDYGLGRANFSTKPVMRSTGRKRTKNERSLPVRLVLMVC